MITIVGGTYDEFCFEPYWKQRFGSGLRACKTIQTLSKNKLIEYHTFCDKKTEKYLAHLAQNHLLKINVCEIEQTIQFYYDHPLISPRIFPRPDTLVKTNNKLNVSGDHILYYGFLEGFAKITGNKVVYDPQSPIMPLSFQKSGSSAKELAYIINITEASILSEKTEIKDILKYFFEVEKAKVVVLKMGPKGAMVVSSDGSESIIPVYKTKSVWPIGSGDVFAAVFAYYWFDGFDPINAALEASWKTACYCATKDYQFSEIGSNPDIIALSIKNYPTKQVYLAGPFFTFSERWLIDQLRTALQDIRLKVFSPWHDVGHGIASDVVEKDLIALEESKILFAVLDGLDTGTVFEIGYAVKKGIPVIAYVENESSESIKMLEGTDCILENDMTTAIYKCFWAIAENE